MKDMRDFRGKGKLPARYRLGGKGRDSVLSRDGEGGRDDSLVERRTVESRVRGSIVGSRVCEYEYEYSPRPRTKFEWERLMAGRQDGGEYQSCRISRSLNEERVGNRSPEFKSQEDVFQEDMSLEMEREQEVMCSGRNVGQTDSPCLVDGRLYIPAKNGYSYVYNSEKMESEGQQEEEYARRGYCLQEEANMKFSSAKGPCHVERSPSHYRFSRPPSYSNLSKAGESPCAEKVGLGGFSPEDAGPDFQLDYIPLGKASHYQPHSRTPSPLCTNKSQDPKDRLLVTESMEGNSKSQKIIVGEDVVGITSGNGTQYVFSSPYTSQSNAKAPSSAGYGSGEREYALTGESPSIENTANPENFRRCQGARNQLYYVHDYMLPSPQYNYKTKAVSLHDCASLDKEQAYIAKQAVAERTERERYLNENYRHACHTVGIQHMMQSPFKLEPKPSMPVSRASDPAAESVTSQLLKPQKCLSSTPLPSHSSLPDSKLSRESSLRLKELHPNRSDHATRVFQCTEGRYQNSTYSEEDVRSRYKYNLFSNKLNGKISSASENYELEDRPWVPDMNGEDACGFSHEPNLKSTVSLQHHRNSQEHGILFHPQDIVDPNHNNRDFDMLHNGMLTHDVKSQAHYHGDWKSGTYEIQTDKFNHLDNKPDAYMDEDSYDSIRRNNALNPRCFHSSSCCDSILHGETRALLKSRYEQDSSPTFKKPCIKHQEHVWNRLGEIDERESGHLPSGVVQCLMLMRRSANLQNKDLIGIGDEAFDNTTDLDCQLPFKKLPIRMRLGEPNNYAVRDSKKRLRSSTYSNAAQLSKKHNSWNPPIGLHEMQEPHQGRSSDHSASKVTSEIAELDEHSDKFKEQVNRAFLESVKNLFQSSAQQRKFMGLDTYESLRCDICGSSRDFKDARSLAKHSFSCVKMDARAQHLGLHKALCVLMGWNNLVSPDSPTNILNLSKPEHSAVKEDLIIWPPVVIVHNSSVGNKDLRKQKIITVSKLESFLKGEGFGGNSRKVHTGNDQGIMVVKFNATLSGLQAAQELHSLYAKKKHGRDELEHLTLNGGCGGDEQESQEAIQKAEDILYGYMGIVEDLPKLDSQIKKWSVIKSKKALLAATAP